MRARFPRSWSCGRSRRRRRVWRSRSSVRLRGRRSRSTRRPGRQSGSRGTRNASPLLSANGNGVGGIRMIPSGRAFIAACALALAACGEGPPKALGTLEYDRITVPAPVAEKIVSIDVREGEQVTAGTVLMTLDRTRVEAETQVTQAEAQRQRDALAELEAGARSEQIQQARANL